MVAVGPLRRRASDPDRRWRRAGIRRAARLADGIYSNATANGFLGQLEWIRDECDPIGRDPALSGSSTAR